MHPVAQALRLGGEKSSTGLVVTKLEPGPLFTPRSLSIEAEMNELLRDAILSLSRELDVSHEVPIFDGGTLRLVEYTSHLDVWVPTVSESVGYEKAVAPLSVTPDDQETRWRAFLLIWIIYHSLLSRFEVFPGVESLAPISAVIRDHTIGLSFYFEMNGGTDMETRNDPWEGWLLGLRSASAMEKRDGSKE